jgi:hypothetical protein
VLIRGVSEKPPYSLKSRIELMGGCVEPVGFYFLDVSGFLSGAGGALGSAGAGVAGGVGLKA